MNWRKIAFIVLDVVLAGYLCAAVTVFNKPEPRDVPLCKGVAVTIDDDIVEGFLNPQEVLGILRAHKLDPTGLPINEVRTRLIEETLQADDLIEHAECYTTQGGTAMVHIHQRIPVVRVMSLSGADYYVDSQGRIMPPTTYTCNLIVATGHISRKYATATLAPVVTTMLRDDFWRNQVEQINVLPDGSIELVPRVGDHIAYLGAPTGMARKLDRLRKFYRYGLSEAGWNKYSRISVEFDKQIICKRKKEQSE